MKIAALAGDKDVEPQLTAHELVRKCRFGQGTTHLALLATGRLPAVNLIEWSPSLFDREVLDGHRRRAVQLEGYSPLKSTNLHDPRLVQIAEGHGVTPAQVVLRWHVEHGIVAIPKSTSAERIAENAAIFGFELTPCEVERLDRLG